MRLGWLGVGSLGGVGGQSCAQLLKRVGSAQQRRPLTLVECKSSFWLMGEVSSIGWPEASQLPRHSHAFLIPLYCRCPADPRQAKDRRQPLCSGVIVAAWMILSACCLPPLPNAAPCFRSAAALYVRHRHVSGCLVATNLPISPAYSTLTRCLFTSRLFQCLPYLHWAALVFCLLLSTACLPHWLHSFSLCSSPPCPVCNAATRLRSALAMYCSTAPPPSFDSLTHVNALAHPRVL
jgi:hypothetical protein